MIKKKYSMPKQFNLKSIIERMLLGAGIGLLIISFFVFSVDEPNPEWGSFWKIRPLIITPLAGAFGIISFYFKDFIRPRNKLITIIVILFSIIAFLFALWIGIILGLNGTLWN